jgi:hypothetical protein
VTTFSTVSRAGSRPPSPFGGRDRSGRSRAEGCQGKRRSGVADIGQRRGWTPVVREGWSPGRPGRAPASARRRPARAARRQVRAPGQVRTENPPRRTRELTSARTASGHEHQGDHTKPQLDPAKLKSRHLRGSGRRPLPEPPPGIVDVSRNLSRAPTASPARWATPTLDRTRPPPGYCSCVFAGGVDGASAKVITDAGLVTVGVLLVVATISQVVAGIYGSPRKGDDRMVQTVRVAVSSALMILASVSTNIATASSHPS